jgi:hypothetical protein
MRKKQPLTRETRLKVRATLSMRRPENNVSEDNSNRQSLSCREVAMTS